MENNKIRKLKNLLLVISITSAVLSVVSATVSLYLANERNWLLSKMKEFFNVVV